MFDETPPPMPEVDSEDKEYLQHLTWMTWGMGLILYNVLLINWHIGNINTQCHSRSMGNNRDLTGVLHQKISSLPVSIASDTRCF